MDVKLIQFAYKKTLFTMQPNQDQSNFSNTKRTLILLLKQEIQELHEGVSLMKEDSLIKNVAKRKVLYNISQTGMLQLVYSYFALAEYYIDHDLLSPALKTIQDSRLLKIVGDSTFLMGQVCYKKGSKQQAVRYLQTCLEEQWIEPSQLHQISSKLQAMTYLQQLYFSKHQRDKLIKLSQDKIKLTQTMGGNHSDNYFQALSLLDMSMIHDSFAEYQSAIDKLQTALTLLSTSNEAPAKQIEMLEFRGRLFGKTGNKTKEIQSYEQVIVKYIQCLSILKKFPKVIDEQKEAHILQLLIQSRLFI